MQIDKATTFNRKSGEMWEFTALKGKPFRADTVWGEEGKSPPTSPR